jgi:hypothetical protein
MSNVLAVCDVEKDYACHFMEYLNQRRKLPFEIQVFTSPEALISYAGSRHVELLLISEKAMSEEVRKIDAGRIIVLSEGGGQVKYEGQYPSVCKYQGAGQVVREVLDCYGAWQKAMCADDVPSAGRLAIAFCSAGEQTLKTEAAVTAARYLAGDRKTLYINLERCSGITDLTGEKYDKTLSDLLFYYHREKNRIAYRLDGVVRKTGGLSFLPPVQSREDIDETGAEEWAAMIREVLRTGEYEAVVLDVEERLICRKPMAELCQKIFVVSGESGASRARCGVLKGALEEAISEEEAERIVAVQLRETPVSGEDLFSESNPHMEKVIREILAEVSTDENT